LTLGILIEAACTALSAPPAYTYTIALPRPENALQLISTFIES